MTHETNQSNIVNKEAEPVDIQFPCKCYPSAEGGSQPVQIERLNPLLQRQNGRGVTAGGPLHQLQGLLLAVAVTKPVCPCMLLPWQALHSIVKRGQLCKRVHLLGMAVVQETAASECKHCALVDNAAARSVLGCVCGQLNKYQSKYCDNFRLIQNLNSAILEVPRGCHCDHGRHHGGKGGAQLGVVTVKIEP